MTIAMVVDDSKTDQRLAGRLLETRLDMTVIYADNGKVALQLLLENTPDVVVTDMQMPEVDGIGVVTAVRRDYPTVPVILMTAHGSEALAAEALRLGASGYVPKRLLSRDLSPTVERSLAIAGSRKNQQHAVECLTSTEARFQLDNDTSRIHPVINYLRQDLAPLGLCDETALMRIGVALDEALSNAIIHGNLGVDSTLRSADCEAYARLIEERRADPAFAQRRVELTATLSSTEAVYVVHDQGEGFDPSAVPDPTDPGNIEKCSGRGLLLIRTFMDEVQHNERGNMITMIKRRDG
ncbi:MAG: response regulator [Phycisphaeraceae bacterium]